ncbi:MAG TPA: hypothetical protein ENF25_02770 [Thermoprotei archaeon]|nr:hypothetical protein [Thermoprotei archaeon]
MRSRTTAHISRISELVSDLVLNAKWFRIEVDKARPYLVVVDFEVDEKADGRFMDRVTKYIDPRCPVCGNIMEYDIRKGLWVCTLCGKKTKLKGR